MFRLLMALNAEANCGLCCTSLPTKLVAAKLRFLMTVIAEIIRSDRSGHLAVTESVTLSLLVPDTYTLHYT